MYKHTRMFRFLCILQATYMLLIHFYSRSQKSQMLTKFLTQQGNFISFMDMTKPCQVNTVASLIVDAHLQLCSLRVFAYVVLYFMCSHVFSHVLKIACRA